MKKKKTKKKLKLNKLTVGTLKTKEMVEVRGGYYLEGGGGGGGYTYTCCGATDGGGGYTDACPVVPCVTTNAPNCRITGGT